MGVDLRMEHISLLPETEHGKPFLQGMDLGLNLKSQV